MDLGHSYTHALPIVCNQVQWRAVRRLDIGGRVLTSLLKVMFSYRQWNMMEETFLTDKMKDTSCFVAAQARGKAHAESAPRHWSFEHLVELFQYVSCAPLLTSVMIPTTTSYSSTCFLITHSPRMSPIL